MSKYTTKATWLGNEYGCRVFIDGQLVVEGRCASQNLIGATFRDLFRTLDKCGGDAFTSAARKRKFKEGNPSTTVKHLWSNLELATRICPDYTPPDLAKFVEEKKQ